MTLTNKQARFVEEYLIDLNSAQAAIRAGYSEKTAYAIGSENLMKPEIQEAIQIAIKKQMERTQITADKVLKELAIVAFADMKDYATVEEGGGIVLKSFDDMPEGTTRAISKLKEKRKLLSSGEGEGDNVVLDSQLEFAHHDKIKALELLGKHLGIFNDKLTISGDPNAPLMPVQIEFVRPDDQG